MSDPVHHPSHYTSGPIHQACGEVIECIDVTEGKSFNLGNVIKYIWRAGLKGSAIEDLRKASWYLDREIDRLRRELPKGGIA